MHYDTILRSSTTPTYLINTLCTLAFDIIVRQEPSQPGRKIRPGFTAYFPSILQRAWSAAVCFSRLSLIPRRLDWAPSSALGYMDLICIWKRKKEVWSSRKSSWLLMSQVAQELVHSGRPCVLQKERRAVARGSWLITGEFHDM